MDIKRKRGYISKELLKEKWFSKNSFLDYTGFERITKKILDTEEHPRGYGIIREDKHVDNIKKDSYKAIKNLPRDKFGSGFRNKSKLWSG